MKSSYIKSFLIAGGMAIAATSCTDLDTEIRGNYTKVPDNPIAYFSEFEGCYYYNRNEAWFGRNFWEVMFLCGDEAVGVNYAGVYDDNGRFRDGSIHNFRPDLQGVGLMGDMLSGITYTNQRILNFGGTGEKLDPAVAPLRAIRAYYHFWIMEMYGDAPILEHPLAEGESVDRSPRADVARWIEAELLKIMDDLDEANDASTYGRPNKWMAKALLAKLYLNWGVYTHPITEVTNETPNEKLDDCIAICDELMNCGLFDLGTGYRKKFYPDNGVHIKDFIYAVPFDPATLGTGYNGGTEMDRWWQHRKNSYLERGIWGWYPNNSVAGIFILTPEAVDRFNLPGDERNEMIAVGEFGGYNSDFSLAEGVITVYKDARHRRELGPLVFAKDFEWVNIKLLDMGAEDDLMNDMKGARLFKYPPRPEDDLTWNRKQSNDIPVFRLADIMLTKAECILRGGKATNGDTPASLINKIRDCAHAPHVEGAPTLQDILDERTRELIMEPWRRNDLIRFGKFENCSKWKVEASPETMADKNKRLMPIPTGEMNTNTNWKQNPGY